MKKISRIWVMIITSALFLSLTACQTLLGHKEPIPDWVNNRPVDDSYYTGIGGSSTNDRAVDMITAKSRAKRDLASSISSKVQSELSIIAQEITEKSASAGNNAISFSTKSVEHVIFETVEQNLKNIETVSDFYSEKDGYWIFLRLNKAEWALIQRKEMAALQDRVNMIIGDAATNSSQSIAKRLSVLSKALNLLSESPYKIMLEGEIDGRRGRLFDIIENMIIDLTSSLSIIISDSKLVIESGRSAKFSVNIRTNMACEPGPLPAVLIEKESGKRLLKLNTDNMGNYSGEISFKDLPLGKNGLIVMLDMYGLGIDEEQMLNQIPHEQQELIIDNQQINTKLSIKVTGDLFSELDEERVYSIMKALLMKKIPVIKISEADEKITFIINVELGLRGIAPNDMNPFYFLHETARISVIRNNRTIFTYQSSEHRDGGLHWTQAHNKAMEMVFQEIEIDQNFINGITSVFTFE
ncbi:MAG: LPP20 family lipoprotein [Deltaproteobacteria bacterium]|nr:LPP20 family lipoprotein [Deltaproteobacteria bacterium]